MKNKFIKSFRKKHKQVKKKSKFLLKHPLIIPVTAFIGFFFVGLILLVSLSGTTGGPSDSHIVNVFVDGDQRTVTTRASTVGELLNRLDVDLIPEDGVEPAKSALIFEDNTQVNIYRARPVQVVDGERVLTFLTAKRAPRLVAHDAGIDLLPEDEVTFEHADADDREVSVSEQLVIQRSLEVQLNVYGVVKSLRTTADSVEDLLVEQNIMPEENETVQPEATVKITASMLISVNRPGLKTEAVNELIPHDSEWVNDDDLTAGKTKVQRAGEDGEQAVIYEIEEQDGVEVSRKQIQVVALKNPVNEIIARGTKITTPSFSPSVTVSGDKASLMAAAGIAESDFGFVDFIISHESGWRPGAANSSSGAYGLCQSLPASKMASAGADYLTNPVTQLRWCSGYANGRYGGWSGAYNAWQAQRWW